MENVISVGSNYGLIVQYTHDMADEPLCKHVILHFMKLLQQKLMQLVHRLSHLLADCHQLSRLIAPRATHEIII
jgi:hypothetical protein